MSQDVEASVALPEIRLLLARLENEARFADNRSATASIMESILSADSEEALFERQDAGAVASKDFLNRPFRLRESDIQWKRSAANFVEEGAFPFYALLTVTEMATGDRVVLDTGASSVVAVLSKLQDLHGFERYEEEGGRPLQFVGKTVASGRTIVMLMPVVLEAAKRAKK